MQEILVALDGGQTSKRVTDFVNRFFADLDVSITAVNVDRFPLAWGPQPLSPGLAYPWPSAGGLWPPAAAPTRSPGLEAAAVDTAERRVESSGLHADDHVVRTGEDVADTIRRIAAERDVDLIVVGSNHKGFLERLASPSVSTDLAKAAPRPVLIVH
jgi:nucleotide-binding universal stress UspA family protein